MNLDRSCPYERGSTDLFSRINRPNRSPENSMMHRRTKLAVVASVLVMGVTTALAFRKDSAEMGASPEEFKEPISRRLANGQFASDGVLGKFQPARQPPKVPASF